MTLEEAKKKIEELGDDAWKKWKKEGNLISQGYALGMDDALGIVDKLDHEPVGNPCKMNLDDVIRNLESDEAVCRSHSEDDYYRGMADGYKLSIDALKKLSRNPEQLTLKELAREMRKIFEFDILTYSAWEDGDCYVTEQLDEIVLWFRRVPDALPEYDETAGNFYGDVEVCALLKISSMSAMVSEAIDLSEYADENGEIDYSRCIVEVSDDIN